MLGLQSTVLAILILIILLDAIQNNIKNLAYQCISVVCLFTYFDERETSIYYFIP